MSELDEKLPNVVPLTRIKKEVILDDEDAVQCSRCWKGFASVLALNNHVRMEHTDLYSTGDSSLWTYHIDKPAKPDEATIKLRKDRLIKSMSPSNVLELASKDVSYIIVKSDDEPVSKRLRKERKKDEKEKNVVKKNSAPITGPFECLQPSTLVADGTCHQIFFSCCDYSIHFRDEHNRRRKGLRCQVCEKPLVAGDANSLPYPCEMCGTGFQSAKELSDHTAVAHTKTKPFQCNICLKRFTQQGGLMQHMRMHTGDRPFPCTFCPKAFTQKSGLDQHLRIHTKVKPYRCVVCSKTFCQSVHLKQHMRTHTNVAPFQCGICEKRFKQSSHLNYHLKNHNPATLTEEQRTKFAELIGMMNNDIVKMIKQESEEVIVCGDVNGGVVTEFEEEETTEPTERAEGVVITELEDGESVQLERVEITEMEDGSVRVEGVEITGVEEGETVQFEAVHAWGESILGN